MRSPASILIVLSLAGLSLILAITGCQTPGQRHRAQEARAAELMQEAEIFLDRQLTDSALAAFGLALEDNPELTQAHLGMGNIYRHRGQYHMASRAYERAIETDPNSYEAHYNLGLVRQFMGDLHQAVRTYLRALTINPNSAEANRDLASAYLQLGRPGEALPYAQRAVELDPDNQASWSNLASALSLLGRYEEAVNAYRQAAELGELAEQVLLGLADAHIHLGNYQQADIVLRSLISEHPSATAHERLGLTMFKLRRFDDALNHYQQALELDPQHTAALNGVGVIHMTRYLQGNREEPALRDQAVEAWRQSLRLRPEQPRIVDLLARFGNS